MPSAIKIKQHSHCNSTKEMTHPSQQKPEGFHTWACMLNSLFLYFVRGIRMNFLVFFGFSYLFLQVLREGETRCSSYIETEELIKTCNKIETTKNMTAKERKGTMPCQRTK
uniref:Uncharacterized protein n=1 Tax=Rhizophora mucronata TaxID=61149 RepID=A0A2P2PWZ2_RHIMU